MNHLAEVLIPISMFAAIFGIAYMYFTARNKERMALIEKGADASIFYGEKKNGSSYWLLKLGLLAIGVAIGALLGNLLFNAGLNEEVAYTSMIFLFGGAGLLGAFFLGRKMNKEDK